jgi:hypothetical protein
VWPRIAIGVVIVVLAAGHVGGAHGQAARSAEPLTPVHAVKGNALRVSVGTIETVDVSRSFRYAGAHRFILKGVADAEQHAFAEADPTGKVQRFLWFQFESLLPAASGVYDYSKDLAVTIGGREWRADVRRYTTPPEPDGDQAQLYAILARKNLRQPLPALRVRLVHLPPGDRRSELMIIYAEATDGTSAPTAAESEGIVARALAALRFHP